MAEIISIDDKLTLAKEKKTAIIQKRKVIAVQKVFQCTQCAFKCEKCGTQINQAVPDPSQKLRIPYRFCESCTEEYIDYIERLKGKGDQDCYWRNESWLKLWRNWIEYQGSVASYMKSKEFRQILKELKQPISDK